MAALRIAAGRDTRLPMQIETSQLRIVAPRSQLNFLDIQSVTLARPLSPIQTYGHLSGWMAQRFGWAFRVRENGGAKLVHGGGGIVLLRAA